MSIQKSFLVAGTLLALASCGDETNVTKVTNETVGMEVAATADSLGTCDSASVGKMMFASDENMVYICADSGWTPLSEKAADGKDGVDGLDGALCTVKTLSAGDGYKVICGGDSVGVILNGTDGSDGKNGNNGSDGKDGANGTSCSVFALPDSSGYKIVCGGDSVGVILNGLDGADGKNGADGKDGTNGTNGTSCSVFALSDGSGYKVVCGGDSVGVILNGANGKDGANGTSCTAAALSDGSGYKIVCGGDSVGVILNGSDGKDGADGKNGADGKDGGSGCNLATDSAGIVKLACGTSDTVTLYKALCGDNAYDPAKTFCFEEKTYDYCASASYDPTKQFCQAGSLYALCGGESYDVTSEFCQDGSLYSLCGGKSYDVMTEYCDGGTVYEVKSKFTDARDGKTYRTVKIGSQIWMAENLNYDYNQNTAKSYCFNNSADSCAKYGRLYTWAAAMDSAAMFSENGKGCGDGKTCSATKPVRGGCPEGWHLPSLEEWYALETYVADNSNGGVGYALKSISGWTAYNGKTGGSDYFGFGALPAGLRNGVGTFYDVQSYANFWSSTEGSASGANGRSLRYGGTNLLISSNAKSIALSVRCVKD